MPHVNVAVMAGDLSDYDRRHSAADEHGGGEAGIRTLGARKDTPDFESGPFGRSGTSPRGIVVQMGG